MIGILITTFCRDRLLFECLNSIEKYWDSNYYIIVVDQGHPSNEKDDFWIQKLKKITGDYIKTDFDIGPLKARNIAIKRFSELNIPYILMFADSMRFLQHYNFQSIINFLEFNENNFLCGFNKTNSVCTWECDMKKTDRFELDIPRRAKIEFENNEFLPVDICRNIFLCKTKLLNNALYDENRKMGDHESSFYRWQQMGYLCYYHEDIVFDYTKYREPEYNKFREKNFNDGRTIMMNQYGLKGWISYSNDLKKKWAMEKQQKLDKS